MGTIKKKFLIMSAIICWGLYLSLASAGSLNPPQSAFDASGNPIPTGAQPFQALYIIQVVNGDDDSAAIIDPPELQDQTDSKVLLVTNIALRRVDGGNFPLPNQSAMLEIRPRFRGDSPRIGFMLEGGALLINESVHFYIDNDAGLSEALIVRNLTGNTENYHVTLSGYIFDAP